jgi:hypothetical protein
MPDKPPEDARIISFMTLRKAVGYLGGGLPVGLWLASLLLSHDAGLRPSVSDYYYTDVRNGFVGDLIAIGVFLLAYRGYDKWDVTATNAAGLFAIVVALFPTAPPDPSTKALWVGRVHLTSAALLFVTLAVISIWLFRKTAPGETPTVAKAHRNTVYLWSGVVILASIAAILVLRWILGDDTMARHHVVFWFEAIALLAFGFSWLTKGQAILKD